MSDCAVLRISSSRSKIICAGALIQISGRFVGQQQRRIRRERARDGNALLLSAGKFTGTMVRAIPKPTSSRLARASADAFAPDSPRIRNGMLTFSSAENSGSR